MFCSGHLSLYFKGGDLKCHFRNCQFGTFDPLHCMVHGICIFLRSYTFIWSGQVKKCIFINETILFPYFEWCDIWLQCKGREISKANFVIFRSFKKGSKCLVQNLERILLVFLENMKIRKFVFEISWPLTNLHFLAKFWSWRFVYYRSWCPSKYYLTWIAPNVFASIWIRIASRKFWRVQSQWYDWFLIFFKHKIWFIERWLFEKVVNLKVTSTPWLTLLLVLGKMV